MKKLPFYLTIVALALIASQCNPIEPDEPDIKPKRDIAEKWAKVAELPDNYYYFFYGLTGDILEFWTDSTYKVFKENVLIGDGTYTYYLRSLYPEGMLYPFISITGYRIALLGSGGHCHGIEYSVIHLIGDSVCPPYPVGYSLPEGFWEEMQAHNIFGKEILVLEEDRQFSHTGPVIYVKLEN